MALDYTHAVLLGVTTPLTGLLMHATTQIQEAQECSDY
uniref:Uncharacterized protein n=1 Tax=Anguilla anguilla TaxID=7936 RepID=A0A0E9TD02_ANGAN